MITIPIYTFITIVVITFILAFTMIFFVNRCMELEKDYDNKCNDVGQAINHYNYWKTKYKKDTGSDKMLASTLMRKLEEVK